MAVDSVDAAFGALLGAFVGDSCGAVLEFNDRHNNPELVERALTMPGGGIFGVGPGQCTDDGELALALASGLSQQFPLDGFPAESVARAYGAWLQSSPFDVGNTCRTAFSAALHHDPAKSGPLAPLMTKQAQFSRDSKANGALMRVMPLAVWGCRLSDEELARAAGEDAKLSHPHEVCRHANAIYCIAVKHLIASPGNAEAAIKAACAWANAHACAEVAGWLKEALGDAAGPPANRLIGFVRYGFFYAFRFLKLRTPFRDALRDTLLLKGDTDTNAAIVCGMLGALHGAAAIPTHMADAVLGRQGQSGAKGPRRPDWLQPGRLPSVFKQLWSKATGEEVDLLRLAGVPTATLAAEATRAASDVARQAAAEAAVAAAEAARQAALAAEAGDWTARQGDARWGSWKNMEKRVEGGGGSGSGSAGVSQTGEAPAESNGTGNGHA
ncbi:hypothetical protein HYH03_009827 [Edaphochlamys debaryana]|uniref:ADP-ribosylglycohydrolase n=1 Tax=Edaphochlamys debaryana TaxID=47281 RepID=A0A836BWU5_9CHLO|nr:hypothetical protein HYH03_009827 [Edaphochlamys debaryana]|eukprot:KAG2491875.1 hypothetical protein HYH03_009827 [Edaphochlamys debaryana]